MANLIHMDLGNPAYQFDDGGNLNTPPEKDEYLQYVARLNSPSRQASEVTWKLSEYVHLASIVLIDTGMLDSAIGQFVLMECKRQQVPCWAVGVDDKTSPLAAAYLRGIVYPQLPDDLVKLCLQEMDREKL